ncbi:acyl-CoA thioesterase II [Kwoniella dendrophila CBS 6074]|uniref:Acyl-CoA thioesterase II n=1 Tax=Kwoniella dendrophila CBS 6074 TaxID=1295534 RepID=A0AAX4JZ83_9TREE
MPPFARLTDLVGVTSYSSSSSSSTLTPSNKSISKPLWVPSGARGVFGGQVIAQSLAASSRTIKPPFGLNSMHCYFLLPAFSQPDIEYRVEILRNGKSYSNRLVRAFQGEREVFVLLASYTLPPMDIPVLPVPSPRDPSHHPSSTSTNQEEKNIKVFHTLRFALKQTDNTSSNVSRGKSKFTPSGVQAVYQTPFPDNLVPWEQCLLEEHRWQKFYDEKCKNWKGARKTYLEEYIRERTESPVGIAMARFSDYDKSKSEENEQGSQYVRMTWLNARLNESEKPDIETAKAMIAYMTDFQFIGTASRSVGLHQSSNPRIGMLASLDHTIHFYPIPPDFDISTEPILHVMESQSVNVSSGRGVVQGRVYTQKGILIAVTSQEGVVRADLRGLEAKGLIEGGITVEDDEGNEKKRRREAKL